MNLFSQSLRADIGYRVVFRGYFSLTFDSFMAVGMGIILLIF